MLRNESVVRESGLEAYIRASYQPVGYEEWMGLYLLKRRSESIETAPDLVQAPCTNPAGKLASNIVRVYLADQKEPGLEDRLLADCLEQLSKVHGSNLPGMASYCNGIGL